MLEHIKTQTVSVELAKRDFSDIRADIAPSIASQIARLVRKPLISRGKKYRKSLYIIYLDLLAGEPGFEPGLTESESVGLPLTYSPIRAASL